MNQRTVEGAPNPVKVKPRFRGVFHEAGFYVSFALAVPLIATAEPGRARVSAAVFATCVATCFGASVREKLTARRTTVIAEPRAGRRSR